MDQLIASSKPPAKLCHIPLYLHVLNLKLLIQVIKDSPIRGDWLVIK